MQNHALVQVSNEASLTASQVNQSKQQAKVFVCVDSAGGSRIAIPPAKAIAKALGAELKFVHVIETQGIGDRSPSDPVAWDIKRREAAAFLSGLAEDYSAGDISISTQVLEGRCADQIGNLLAGRPQDIVVLCRGHGEADAHIGETARKVLESGTSSLLMVPVMPSTKARQGISRVLVPLDGSGQSEGAIPFALKIAKSEDAELVLVHAIPEPAFTQAGPDEPEDGELKAQIRQRNERVARKYLDQLRARVLASGLRVRTVVLSGGDVRRQLTASIEGESADLLVLASHGHSGFADVSLGDVANFALSRSAIPILMVRRAGDSKATHVFADAWAKGTRRPGIQN